MSAFEQSLQGVPENPSISPLPHCQEKHYEGKKKNLKIQNNLSATPKSMWLAIPKAEEGAVGPTQHAVFPEPPGPRPPLAAAGLEDAPRPVSPQMRPYQQEQS